MTEYGNTYDPGTRWLLVVIAAIALGALFVALQLADLPLSNHAVAEPHALDADTIRFQIQNGMCKPVKTWYCDMLGNKHFKVTCPIKGDLWAGLIVGMEGSPVIVSGYVAPSSYWKNSAIRDGCMKSSLSAIGDF